jgi:hypothetical protein
VALRAGELAGVAVWLLLSACASEAPPPRSAADVVRDFARALSDGDAARAYELMAPEYRRRVSLADWQKRFEQNPEEVVEASVRLSHLRDPGAVPQQPASADGARPQLIEREGRFYMASEEIEFYDQSSPRAALRSFVAAFARRRYDVVLRLTPESDKEGVTTDSLALGYAHDVRSDLERLLSQLRAHLEDPIEIDGARAIMPYAGHKRASLILEGGRWRVEQPE